MDRESVTALLSTEGWALLQALPPYDPDTAIALSDRLRREGLDPVLIAAVLTQSRLRAKARTKFGEFADGMLFTATGLEQASRLEVAAHHARRYRAAGAQRIADLTVGIGADSLAFAGIGLAVVAADIDEVTAAIATVNLRHFPDVTVQHCDGLTLNLATVDGIFVDPARRRRGGARVFNPQDFTPALDQVLALQSSISQIGIKLGPGLNHKAVPASAHAQWVSVGGDVVEVGLWFGDLAPEGVGRSALVINAGTATATPVGADQLGTPPVRSIGSYLYEPDGAVIRAGLVSQVAHDVTGGLLDPTIAYVTADRLTVTPLAQAFRIIDDMPFSVKGLRTYLRERQVGRVEIKKRGTAVTPEMLRPQLALRGDSAATIVLTRVRGAQRALIVERI